MTVAYSALVAQQNCEAHIATVVDVQWRVYDELVSMDLAFDQQTIIGLA